MKFVKRMVTGLFRTGWEFTTFNSPRNPAGTPDWEIARLWDRWRSFRSEDICQVDSRCFPSFESDYLCLVRVLPLRGNDAGEPIRM